MILYFLCLDPFVLLVSTFFFFTPQKDRVGKFVGLKVEVPNNRLAFPLLQSSVFALQGLVVRRGVGLVLRVVVL